MNQSIARVLQVSAILGLVLLVGSLPDQAQAQTLTPMAAPKRLMRDLPVWRIDTRVLRQQIVDAAADSISETPRMIHSPSFSGPSNNLEAGGLLYAERSVPGEQWAGIGSTGWYPPDPDIAVGPNHVLEVVNSSVGWFDKATGVKQFQQTGSTFFSGLAQSTFLFDPKAFYDPYNNRFAILFLERDTTAEASHLLIAVSDDNDPNGTWYRYRINARVDANGLSYWIDYPGFGFTKDAYLVSGNMFSFASTGFGGAELIVIPSAELVSGSPANAATFFPAGGASIQIAEMIGATESTAFAASRAGSSSLRIYAVQGASTPNPMLTTALVPVPSHSGPTSDATSTSGQTLDTIDGRVFNVAWRDGSLVTAHSSTPSTGAPVASRWYEVATGNWPVSGSPTLVQAGLVSSPDTHYFTPAININDYGDIGMLFSASNSTITADVMTTSRRAEDPLGFMGDPTLMRSSDGNNYTLGRWGDYFGVDVDPVNGATFWGVGQYVAASNGWASEIVTWEVTHVPPTAPANFSATAVSSSRIDLTWDDAADESSYFLEQSLNGVDFVEIQELPAGTTSYSDTGLADSTTYWYQLRAENSIGFAYSDVAEATTEAPPPYIDTWADGETTFSGSTIGNFTATGLEDNLVETLIERESGGRPSRRSSLLEHEWQFSNVPGGLAITLFVVASAPANGENDNFEFQVSNNGGQSWISALTVYNGTEPGTLHLRELSFNNSGPVLVRLIDTDQTQGNRNLDSIDVDLLFLRTDLDPNDFPPAAPSGLAVAALSSAQVQIDWSDNSTNERGFRIYRSIDGGSNWNQIAATGPDTTAYTDEAAVPNTVYLYDVAAFTASYETASGAPVGVTTPDGISLSASGTKRKGVIYVDLVWEGGSSLTNVDIWRGTDGGAFERILTVPVGDGGVTDNTGLKGGHILVYKVCDPNDLDFCSSEVTLGF